VQSLEEFCVCIVCGDSGVILRVHFFVCAVLYFCTGRFFDLALALLFVVVFLVGITLARG